MLPSAQRIEYKMSDTLLSLADLEHTSVDRVLADRVEALTVEITRLSGLVAELAAGQPDTTPDVVADRFAGVPGLTEKMRARLDRALAEGMSPGAAVEYATGSVRGRRAEALIEVLTGGKAPQK